MTHHIGYIHGSKLEPFLPPSFCHSGRTSGIHLLLPEGMPPGYGQALHPQATAATADGGMKQ